MVIEEASLGLGLMKKIRQCYCFILLCLLSVSGAGYAEGRADDGWRFTVAFPMLWGPSFSGSVDAQSGSLPIEMPLEDVIKDLHAVFLGEFYAEKGRLSAGLRVSFLELQETNTVKPGRLFSTHDVKTDLDMGVVDLLARYRVYNTLRLYSGLRNIRTKMTMDFSSRNDSLININENISVMDESDWDIIGGAEFNLWVGPHWGVLLSGDARLAGDTNQDINLEARGIYRINRLNNVWFGYRYFNVVTSVDNSRVDLGMSGPTLGWAFTF